MPAVVTFTFNPVLQLTDTASVRWETIGLAIVLLLGLLLTARIGSRLPARAATLPDATTATAAPAAIDAPAAPAARLRLDDLAFMVVGAVPGAIVGGRLGYVLDHLDYYSANPSSILDPAQGGLTLTLAVPLGILTGAAIARLLGAPMGRWMQSIALPLLFVLAAGKAVGVLGATGQGAPSDLQWATAYQGPGPWAVLGADVPSHPSQLYEAILIGLAILGVGLASRIRVLGRREGAALFVALGLWSVARFVTAFTWRDPAAMGPLRVEQVQLLLVLLVAIVGIVERSRAPKQVPLSTGMDTEARLA